MRTVGLLVRIPTPDAEAALGRIADFAAFPALAEDVRAVTVRPAPAAGQSSSDWEVSFRHGVLRWGERDSVDAARLAVEFERTGGDFAEFRGAWRLTQAGDGCEVAFTVTYDFGIESLAGLLDPIAERVVKRVVRAVLAGLFGDITVLAGGEALTDLAGAAPSRPERNEATPWIR